MSLDSSNDSGALWRVRKRRNLGERFVQTATFFAFYEDAHIQQKVGEVFDVERFNVLQMPDMQPNYQSIIAKRKQLNP